MIEQIKIHVKRGKTEIQIDFEVMGSRKHINDLILSIVTEINNLKWKEGK